MKKLLIVLSLCACGGSQKLDPQTGESHHEDTKPVVSSDELAVGKPAPAFSVVASDGAKIDSAELKGKPVVLYFYPKDETPGCTAEACDFRDNHGSFVKAGAEVLGDRKSVV